MPARGANLLKDIPRSQGMTGGGFLKAARRHGFFLRHRPTGACHNAMSDRFKNSLVPDQRKVFLNTLHRGATP